MQHSVDGIYIYFTPLSSRRFYRITTASLLVEPSAAHPSAADNALQAVQFLGDLGSHADGLESDSTGAIYATAPEHNSLTVFRPETGLMELFVRDPRLQWPVSLPPPKSRFFFFICHPFSLSPFLAELRLDADAPACA